MRQWFYKKGTLSYLLIILHLHLRTVNQRGTELINLIGQETGHVTDQRKILPWLIIPFR